MSKILNIRKSRIGVEEKNWSFKYEGAYKMKYCRKCGAELRDDDVFCPKC